MAAPSIPNPLPLDPKSFAELTLRHVRFLETYVRIPDIRVRRTMTVGRDPASDIVLTHPFEAEAGDIKHDHAVIEMKPDGTLTLRSAEGAASFVNGRKVLPGQEVTLALDVQISFGIAVARSASRYNPFVFSVMDDAMMALPPPPPDMLKLNEDQRRIMRQSFLCPLCHKTILRPYSVQCGHSMCSECMVAAFRAGNMKCAVCPNVTNIRETKARHDAALHAFVETTLVPYMSDEEREQRRIRDAIWSARGSYVLMQMRRGEKVPGPPTAAVVGHVDAMFM
jgi:hypothetical protein